MGIFPTKIAEQGLVALMGDGGKISYKHIDALVKQDLYFVTAAEQVEVE